jgi:two-component system, cell cycle sensor histidine kinase and response regulator CckA
MLNAVEEDVFKILIVEDDEDDFFLTRSLLARASRLRCDLEWSRSYAEGLEALQAKTYDACLIDYRLGPDNGLELLEVARGLGTTTPMILLTGQGDVEVDLKAMLAGAADYLVKGQIDAQLLERSIRYARERKRAEDRIRGQAALLDEARDAISAYDLQGRVIYWNKSAARLTGWDPSDIVGMSGREERFSSATMLHSDAWNAVNHNGEWAGEQRLRNREGDEIIVESRWTLVRDSHGQPQSILTINTDITERKKLEDQFLRSQRMESIGTLVGGIAHDLGNLLVPILLGVKVLQQRHVDEKTQRTLSMIQKSAQRGADMVKQVLAFARGVEGERVPVRTGEILSEVERILRETFPPTVTVDIEVEDGLGIVIGDVTQLQQVLMNLCVNARDAMVDGGRLQVRAENTSLTRRSARMHLDANPGDFVRVIVSDTGSGIPPTVIDKIFEPFFTTKPIGKGTGLGLSTVYSIVKSHGGFITVNSRENEGTTFTIFLPSTKETPDMQMVDGIIEPIRGKGQLILVADDEEVIREAAEDMLEDAGYRVITAANGREALSRFEEHNGAIEAVITDIMMPEMDGFEFTKRLRESDINVPVIAVSGMAGSPAQQAFNAGASAFLVKPFTAERLCATLGELIQARESQASGSQ